MTDQSPCCSPSIRKQSSDGPFVSGAEPPRGNDAKLGAQVGGVTPPMVAVSAAGLGIEFVQLDGGSFRMGDDSALAYPADGESPVRTVVADPFEIGVFAVTNEQFSAFVHSTGYSTTAQRDGWSFVFGGHLPDDFPATRGVVSAPWWRQVFGADWTRPEGPQSDIEGRERHPVVHVSHDDATAFAQWAGCRLPNEVEWEFAARAMSSSVFGWGDELEPDGVHMANVFQGDFPVADTALDGWSGTCPVGSFPPNSFGIFEMIGNVWEWTADTWSVPIDKDGTRSIAGGGEFTLKGGSYLCHGSYCHRYRPAARIANPSNTSTGHIGFRVARDRPGA